MMKNKKLPVAGVLIVRFGNVLLNLDGFVSVFRAIRSKTFSDGITVPEFTLTVTYRNGQCESIVFSGEKRMNDAYDLIADNLKLGDAR